MNNCELCNLKKVTNWYFENNMLIVCECKDCKVPMAVLKTHKKTASKHEDCYMEFVLDGVARAVLGDNNYRIDKKPRKIKGHIHYHARRKKS